MAEIVGGLAMSHAPQLMLNPDQWRLLNTRSWDPLPVSPELETETLDTKWDKWRQCHAAIERLRERLDALAPDTVIIVGDDQHENLLDDNLPPFSVLAGRRRGGQHQPALPRPATHREPRPLSGGRALGALARGDVPSAARPAYSRQTRYVGGLGHAFARPLKFLLPEARYRIVPIMVNTYYPPAPSARRCVQFGQALAGALRDYADTGRVVVISFRRPQPHKDRHRHRRRRPGRPPRRRPRRPRAPRSPRPRRGHLRDPQLDRRRRRPRPPRGDPGIPAPLPHPTGVGCAMGFAAWQCGLIALSHGRCLLRPGRSPPAPAYFRGPARQCPRTLSMAFCSGSPARKRRKFSSRIGKRSAHGGSIDCATRGVTITFGRPTAPTPAAAAPVAAHPPPRPQSTPPAAPAPAAPRPPRARRQVDQVGARLHRP